MTQPNVIHWFNQDLRLLDNPALSKAIQDSNVLAVYILDDDAEKTFTGRASMVWLHHSLISLKNSLDGKLSFFRGDPLSILSDLCIKYQIREIFWNQIYEPQVIKRDEYIRYKMNRQGVSSHIFNGSLLWDPNDIKKDDGTPYKVFTPFYRRGCLTNAPDPRKPLCFPKYNGFLDRDIQNLQKKTKVELFLKKVLYTNQMLKT